MKKLIIEELVYKVSTLVKSEEFNRYSDVLLSRFKAGDYITKEQAKDAIKKHLEREVR